MLPTWAVVATVDEPAPLVAAFVTHHLEQGAKEIHLFLDRPDPETLDLLAGVERCRITLCDDAHWQASAHGRRPKLHTLRQTINANLAYLHCSADWLLHCDADEFLRSGRALRRELARLPETVLHLRLPVAERVTLAETPQTTLFEGLFRRRMTNSQRAAREIYGPLQIYLDRGLTGHPNGKAVVRTRADVRLGIHQPTTAVPSKKSNRNEILHFDGLTDFHYLLKLIRRSQEPPGAAQKRHKAGRRFQFTEVGQHLGEPEYCNLLVRHLKSLDVRQAEMLEDLGLLDANPFAPTLGERQLDLSVAGFDRLLRANNRDFLQAVAPAFLDQAEPGVA